MKEDCARCGESWWPAEMADETTCVWCAGRSYPEVERAAALQLARQRNGYVGLPSDDEIHTAYRAAGSAIGPTFVDRAMRAARGRMTRGEVAR